MLAGAASVPNSLLKELLNLRDTLANALEETKQTEALNNLVMDLWLPTDVTEKILYCTIL